jgi:hypothetical protein
MNQSASGNKRLNPAVLLFVVYTCSGPPGVPLKEVREIGFNRGNLRMLEFLPESRRRTGGEGQEIGCGVWSGVRLRRSEIRRRMRIA